jgi:hypothetical protein
MLRWLSRDGEDCPDDVFKKMGQNGKFPSREMSNGSIKFRWEGWGYVICMSL